MQLPTQVNIVQETIVEHDDDFKYQYVFPLSNSGLVAVDSRGC